MLYDGHAVAAVAATSALLAQDAARLIAGHRSEALEEILGWRGRDEIIHRDDMVLL